MVSKIKSPSNVYVRKSDNCEGRSSVEQSIISAATLMYDVTVSTIGIKLTYKYVLVLVCMYSTLHYL